ncbi:MAG: endonuclease, partial [Actinomycetota bacterium]|nr:endonuclease [Actinomycetota bacterium]
AAPLVELRRDSEERMVGSAAARQLERLGPDLCEPEPDLDDVMARLRLLDPTTEVGVALLDQRVASGIGNVYKSEVCWAERVSPFTPLESLDDSTRRQLFETAHRLLRANLSSGRRVTHGRGLAVYGRVGRACPRCHARVRCTRSGEAARVSFWCPTCQPSPVLVGRRARIGRVDPPKLGGEGER